MFLIDGSLWDLSNLTTGVPEEERSSRPEEGESSVEDDLQFPSYPRAADIPKCLDVDEIFDKLKTTKQLKGGRLANPQLAGLSRRGARSRKPTLSRRTKSLTGEQGSQGRNLSPHGIQQKGIERVVRHESYEPKHFAQNGRRYFRERQEADNYRRREEDAFKRMQRYRSRTQARENDGYHRSNSRNVGHQHPVRGDNLYPPSSRRDEDYRRPRRSDTYGRSYDDGFYEYDDYVEHDGYVRSRYDRYRTCTDADYHESNNIDCPRTMRSTSSPVFRSSVSSRTSQQYMGYNRNPEEYTRRRDNHHRQNVRDDPRGRRYLTSEDEYDFGSREDFREFRRPFPGNDYPQRYHIERSYYDEQQQDHYDEQQEEEDYYSDDDEERKMVEVTPGNFVPLRGSAETWEAIRNMRIQKCVCYICTSRLVCVEDADMVMCPGCRAISPIEGGRGGGLGLGMKEEDASIELQRLKNARTELQRLEMSEEINY